LLILLLALFILLVNELRETVAAVFRVLLLTLADFVFIEDFFFKVRILLY